MWWPARFLWHRTPLDIAFFNRLRGGIHVSALSLPGKLPLKLRLDDSIVQVYAGQFLQWEFAGSRTPAKNADGSYAITLQADIAFIDGANFGALDESLGFYQPGGNIAFHCRVLAVDPTNSLPGVITVTNSKGDSFAVVPGKWSNDYNDHITDSAGAWVSTVGKSLNSSVTISNNNLTATNTVGGNVFCGVRATIQSINNDWQVEDTIASLIATGTSANGDVIVGVAGGPAEQDFSVSNVDPGSSASAPGCTCRVRWDTAAFVIAANNSISAVTGNLNLGGGTGAALVGDTIIYRGNFSGGNPVVTFWYWRVSDYNANPGSYVPQTLGSVTLTVAGSVPQKPYACAGGFKNPDGVTTNFGGSPYLYNTGAGIYA